MKKTVVTLMILLSAGYIFGQCATGPALTVNNPSFEGTPQAHVTPPGWDICMPGVTPDTQPGSWGCALPPSNGSSYLGLVYSPSISWQEGAGQTLSAPMVAGTTYNFTIDLATMASADPATGIVLPPWCAYLELWGGMSGVNSGCDKAELLWSSATITNFAWVTNSLVFTPTSNWNHILFLINTPNPACTDGQYILLDNMSTINPIADIAEFTWHDVCAGSPVVFHDSSTSASGVINGWNWNFGDGTPNSTLQNPSHNYSAPGTYNVTLTTYSTVPCTTVVTHVINVWPIPTVTASAAPTQICLGQSATLTGSGATTYTWQPGALTGTTVTVNPTTTTTYTVTGTSNSCSATSTVTVNVVQSIAVTATASPPTVCLGTSSDLTASGASTYVWDPGAIAGSTLTVTPAATTTYTVTGTTGAGCSGTTTVTVTVITSITVAATANPAIICEGQSSTLSGGGAQNYQWEPGSISGSSITVTPATTTIYTLTGNTAGCTGTATVTVDVYPDPDVVITADIFTGCEDLLIQFSDLSNITNATWYWDFGDYGFSYEQNPQHLYIDPGVYDVSLTITTQYGCTSTYMWPAMITVYKLPHAYFTPNPDIVSELDPTIFFNDQSISADGWNWNFGDTNHLNNVSNLEDPIHTFTDTGYYTVTLVALTNEGCTDTIRQTIYVEPNVSYYLPNAFTPNDDGKNSHFTMFGEGIKWSTFVMRIYDRWGKTLYYTQDNEKGWDGTVKGKIAPQGVYTYMVTFTDIKFREYKLKGFVVLIK